MASQNFHLLVFLVSLFSYLTTTSSQQTISVSPKILTKSNRTIQIQWSGIVPSPTDLDWVGIYSPSTSRDQDFIGYLFLNASATYQSGSGSISLPLTNLRSDYQFRIFRWTREEVSYRHVDHDGNPLPKPKHRLAVSDPVEFLNKSGPDQVHLAFADAEDEMRVVFVTGDGRSDYVVRYGREKGGLEKEVGTQVRRYEREDMCDWPANATIGWRDPGFVHDGVMKELEKGKRYFYKV